MINIHNMDCMEAMKDMQDNQFDLAIVDPPYNINKANWDKYKKYDYYKFILNMMLELQRILKENASLYLFHNDFLQLSEIQHLINKNTNYIFRQLIIWNKRFNLSSYKGFFDGYVEIDNLRNYQKLCEYICFYTFQDENGLSKIKNKIIHPIRNYLRSEIIKSKGKISLKEINKILGTATNGGGCASAYLSIDKTCPLMITKEHYLKLKKWLNDGKDYEYLRKDYEYLRKDYESLRYYFNNQKKYHSVWNVDIAKKTTDHPTEKPVDLIKIILNHSGRPNGKIIDPFLGSGSIAIACHDLKFDLEGYEIDKDYYDKACERLKNHQRQLQFNL